MDLDARDASRALADIDAAAARSTQLQRYRGFAPHMILWGAIWMVANLLTDLWPAQSGIGWLLLSALGMAGSFWLGSRTARQAARSGHGPRWLQTLAAIIVFQVLALAVLPPLTGRQQGAFLSLLWTCLYTAAGAWLGWRLTAIGALATALIAIGYFHLASHFFLFMGCVTSASLIAGGLWLRRA